MSRCLDHIFAPVNWVIAQQKEEPEEAAGADGHVACAHDAEDMPQPQPKRTAGSLPVDGPPPV